MQRNHLRLIGVSGGQEVHLHDIPLPLINTALPLPPTLLSPLLPSLYFPPSTLPLFLI